MTDSSSSDRITGERGRIARPPSLTVRLVAETVGTALLVIFGAGAVVAALRLGDGALDYAGLGIVAISFGLVIAIVVYAFGEVSGAHINPAVTLALAATRRFPWAEVVPYVAVQLLGGVLGGLLLVGAFGSFAVDVGVGGTALEDGVNFVQGGVAEAVGTFLLMSAVMAMAVDSRAPAGWSGWIIGLSVSCSIMVVGPLTGSALNPARTLGPYVATALFGGEVPWADFVVYVVGPVLGALVAAFAYTFIARPAAPGSQEEPMAEQDSASSRTAARPAPPGR